MSLLAYGELCTLVDQGVITNVTREMINSTSIDLTLGDTILYEHIPQDMVYRPPLIISMRAREALKLREHDLNSAEFFLEPGEFILAQSRQVFNLPTNISAEYKLKSSMARVGLEHLNAGWCDAGWNGSVLTLELKNMTRNHILKIEKDIPIGQMVFFSHLAVPADKSYAARGRYNGDKTVKGIKE